jgi:hypothetical protein
MKIHGGPTTMAGAPDIIACVPVSINLAVPDGIGLDVEEGTIGIFIGFETKMPDGVVSPIQNHVHGKIRDAYGQVFVPRSVEDALKALKAVGWQDVPPARRGPSVDN